MNVEYKGILHVVTTYDIAQVILSLRMFADEIQEKHKITPEIFKKVIERMKQNQLDGNKEIVIES